jgi:hypothetical protein
VSTKGSKKATTPAAMPDLDAVAADWKLQEPMTGSASGCFNLRLLNQLWRAMCAVGPHDDAWHEELGQRATRGALLGIAPRDPLEGMLAAQMLAIHDTAMECLRRAHIPDQTFEGRQANLAQANKLVRSYAGLLEALNKHRGKGQQVVRVEHVTVQAGGQAIVGAVSQGGGDGGGSDERSHAKGAAALAHAPECPLRCPDPQGDPVPLARGER